MMVLPVSFSIPKLAQRSLRTLANFAIGTLARGSRLRRRPHRVRGGERALDGGAIDLAGAVERQLRHDGDETRVRIGGAALQAVRLERSGEHTSVLQSHSFISYAVFCL